MCRHDAVISLRCCVVVSSLRARQDAAERATSTDQGHPPKFRTIARPSSAFAFSSHCVRSNRRSKMFAATTSSSTLLQRLPCTMTMYRLLPNERIWHREGLLSPTRCKSCALYNRTIASTAPGDRYNSVRFCTCCTSPERADGRVQYYVACRSCNAISAYLFGHARHARSWQAWQRGHRCKCAACWSSVSSLILSRHSRLRPPWCVEALIQAHSRGEQHSASAAPFPPSNVPPCSHHCNITLTS